MGRDDLFRRSFEAGMSFLDMSRERAEALVKDLVKAGEVSKGKAQKAIDDLLERSRKGGEELRQLIRREISQQIGAMGLATREDVARVEARLAEMAASAPPPATAHAASTAAAAAEMPAPAPPPSSPPPPGDAPPPPTAAPAKAAAVKRAPRKAPAATKAAGQVPPLKKAGPPRKKPAAPAPPPADEG